MLYVPYVFMTEGRCDRLARARPVLPAALRACGELEFPSECLSCLQTHVCRQYSGGDSTLAELLRLGEK